MFALNADCISLDCKKKKNLYCLVYINACNGAATPLEAADCHDGCQQAGSLKNFVAGTDFNTYIHNPQAQEITVMAHN